jgi:predicted nucleic acid-binding protein
MAFLVDTNVLSELSKRRRNERVDAWFRLAEADTLYISAISIGEISLGIEKVADTQRRSQLEAWMRASLLEWFFGRILAIDADVMRTWAALCAKHRTLPVMDSLIAAQALSAKMVLVTRNVKDFADIEGLDIFNPWEA